MVYIDKESGIICISDHLTEEDAKNIIPFLILLREFAPKNCLDIKYFDLDEIQNEIEKLQYDEIFSYSLNNYGNFEIIPYNILNQLFFGKTIDDIAEELSRDISTKRVKKVLDKKVPFILNILWGKLTSQFPIINDISINGDGTFTIRNISIQDIPKFEVISESQEFPKLESLFFDATRSERIITIQGLKGWLDTLGETQNDSINIMKEIIEKYDDALTKKKKKLIAIGLSEKTEEKQQMDDISDIELFEGESLLDLIGELDLPNEILNTLKFAGINTIQDFIGKTEIDLGNFRNIGKDIVKDILAKLEKRGIVFSNNDNNGVAILQYSREVLVDKETLREIAKKTKEPRGKTPSDE